MGEEELLERLGNPFWFQGFSNIIGMDWDSSGSTTVVIHILKQVLEPGDGLAVLGGKGGEWATAVPTELRGGWAGGSSTWTRTRWREPAAGRQGGFNASTGWASNIHPLHAGYEKGGEVGHHTAGNECGHGGVRQTVPLGGAGGELRQRASLSRGWGGEGGRAANVIEAGGQEGGTRKLLIDLLNEDPRKLVREYRVARSMLGGGASMRGYTEGRLGGPFRGTWYTTNR